MNAARNDPEMIMAVISILENILILLKYLKLVAKQDWQHQVIYVNEPTRSNTVKDLPHQVIYIYKDQHVAIPSSCCLLKVKL